MVAPTDPAVRYDPAAGVVSRQVGVDTVLVDLDGERYFSLNRAGSVTWSRLAAGASIEEALATVVDTFDVDATTAQADLAQLVDQLLGAGLLVARA